MKPITPEVFRGFFYGRRLLVGKPSKLQGHCLLTEGPTGIMLTLSLVLAHQIGESQAARSTYPASFDSYGPTWTFRIQPGPLFLSCLNFAAPKPLRSYSRPNNPYSIAMTWSDFRCRLPICRIYRHPISNVSIRVIAPAQAGTNSRRPDGCRCQ